jgi:hypothetical protein
MEKQESEGEDVEREASRAVLQHQENKQKAEIL